MQAKLPEEVCANAVERIINKSGGLKALKNNSTLF